MALNDSMLNDLDELQEYCSVLKSLGYAKNIQIDLSMVDVYKRQGMESIAFAEAVGADLNYRTLKELRYALSAEMFNILAFLLLSWLQLQTVTGCL